MIALEKNSDDVFVINISLDLITSYKNVTDLFFYFEILVVRILKRPYPFLNCHNAIKSTTFSRIFVNLTLSQTSPGFYVSEVQVFRKHYGKRRNCSSRAISPFPTVFSTRLENFVPFSWNF